MGAALATKANSEDAIDAAVLKVIADPKALGRFKQTNLVPFDPVNKRTMTTVVDANGKTWEYAKGAPQAISVLCKLDPTTEGSYSAKVDDLAKHGYRALGVASSADDGLSWTLLGLLPLQDPPRPDARATIAQTKGLGLSVKMVTGDDVAIGSEIAEQLGLGTHLLVAGDVFPEKTEPDHIPLNEAKAVERADGFGRVFPQHKYEIVKSLQELGHIVAMTGDGVNDAPARSSKPIAASPSAARLMRPAARPH